MNIREYGLSLISKISQERFFQYYKQLERNQWLKKDAIEHRQLTKLKNLLNYAVENISFYKERFRNFNIKDFKGLDDIKQLPGSAKDETKISQRERRCPQSKETYN